MVPQPVSFSVSHQTIHLPNQTLRVHVSGQVSGPAHTLPQVLGTEGHPAGHIHTDTGPGANGANDANAAAAAAGAILFQSDTHTDTHSDTHSDTHTDTH